MTETERLRHRLDRLERQLAVANRAVGLVRWTFVFDGPGVADSRYLPEGDDASDLSTWMTLGKAIPHFSLDRETGETVLAAIQARVDARAPDFELEYPVRQPDGTVQWRLARGSFRYGADGTPIAMDGIAVDITTRKLGEEAAEKEERATEMLTQATKLLQVNVWRYVLEDGVIDLATAEVINAFESLGYDPATVPTDFAERIALFVVPEDQPGLVAALDAAVRGDTPTFETEFRMRHANGSIRWHRARGIVSRDDTGKPLSLLVTSYDVTALKVAEEEVRRAKDQLELSIFGSKAATWDIEVPDGRFENARLSHTNFVELLGYTRAEIPDGVTQAVPAVMPPESAAVFYGDMKAQLHSTERGWESVYLFHAKDGSDRWLLSRGVIRRVAETGVANRFTGISVDITERVLAERALRESEQRFRAMFETTAVGFCLNSPVGDCLDCNETLGRLLGHAREEIVGKNFPQMFYGEDLEATRGRMQDLLAGKVTHDLYDRRFRKKDGTYTWLSVTFSVVNRNADAGSLRFLGIFQDINERKRLEEHLRRTTERLELGVRGSGTVVFDLEMPEVDIPVALGAPLPEGPRSTLNLIGWESLGYDAPPSFNDADRIGAMLHHPEDGLRAHQVTAAYLRGETPKLETEYRIRHADGSYSWRLARGEALRRPNGRPTRLIGSLVDITELKRIEAELHAARQAAELANRAKDEFLANVSHEIRTPMNAILGMTELALDASETAHQRQLLSTVKVAARNLLHVINDLLDFSKITAGKLALDHDDFSLRAAIGDTLRALTVRAHRKGLELVCDVHDDVPDLLFGDAGRVRQVLINLIGNAIKFTARGEVVLTVGLDPEAAGAAPASDDGVPLCFTVRDTGIGIAPEKHASIFRAFEQEDASTTRKFGGTGLGLTISAQLATLMGGRITVESEPGRGSTFAFMARISRSAKPEWPGLSLSGQLDGLSVLVVDDNETNRHILTEWLSHWRMRPTAAGDAAATVAALERAHQSATPFPLVLLDSRMPDTDGITLARQIRERFGPAAHRFILLSSDHSAALAARARAAGIHAYLLKPVQQSELLETIWAVMRSAAELDDDVTADVPPDAARRERSLHILVAQDNELNVALLRELLDQRGHRIEVAGDGRTALELATRSGVAYDVMLLDLHMPELDGFEVVRGIREHERGRGVHLPVIALTARSTKRDREGALAAGMDDFLSKPIEVTALWNAIDRATSAAPPLRRPPVLLDARAIRQMCGGRETVLDRLCEVLRRTVPEQLGVIKDALKHCDFARLRVAAHKLAGTVAGFSSMAGSLASSLEDAAAAEDLVQSTSLAGHLEAASAALLEETRGLTLESLGR